MEYLDIDNSIIQLVTSKQAWHYSIIPKLKENGSIHLYHKPNGNDQQLKEELELVLGKKIALIGVDESILQNSLKKYYYSGSQAESLSDNTKHDFIDQMILESLNLGSSDIHIEVSDEQGRVRYRVDGKLVERFTIKLTEYAGVINKIKIRSKLDISEKRLPQDGRMNFASGDEEFDIRVSILPTLHGEKVVMRLLTSNQTLLNFGQVGMSSTQQKEYIRSVSKVNGIILISGPTGSGKTTTLYTTLNYLNKPDFNVITIEDPIEYTIDGINQVQLKESIGLTFSSALRTFLRQDPDIIMLGEIRDPETAKMAIRAALTGHLVLSTVHTNSALGTISRLLDMGVPGYLLADTLNVCVAQRLIRKLCTKCKQASTLDVRFLPLKFKKHPLSSGAKIFLPKGCPECQFTGYKGRRALFEIVTIDVELKEVIKKSTKPIEEAVREKGVKSLDEIAFDTLIRGITSLDEVLPILLTGE